MLYSRKTQLFGVTPSEPINVNAVALRRFSGTRTGQTVLPGGNEWQIDCKSCHTALRNDIHACLSRIVIHLR
jgi:hypothetical protein